MPNTFSPSWTKKIISICLLGLLGGMPALAANKKITVTGVGYDEKAAIANALRHAVDEGATESMKDTGSAETREKLNAKILTQASGYVTKYDVITSEKDFGLYKVKLTAEVSMGKLEDDLVAQKLLFEMKNKPRIMVILDERDDGKEMFEKTATHKFEEILLARGFKVVDPVQFKEVQEFEKAKGLADTDLATLGFRSGADLVIRGGISAGKGTPKDIYGKQFYTVPIQLNAHIVKADNAEIIASKTQTIKKNSQEEFSATQFGLQVGGEALAQTLINDLMGYWRSEAYSQSSVELMVSGMNEAALAKLETQLKGVEFIKEVRLRFFETKGALFDIGLRGSVQDLRDLFANTPSLNLTVTHLTANRIGVKAGAEKAVKVEYTYAPTAGLEITAFEIKEIFPSRVRNYEQNPLAMVKLKCVGAPADEIKLSVLIPGLMDLPGETLVKAMNPGEEIEVPLKLILNSGKVLQNRETKALSGLATLTYSQGKSKSRKLTAPVKVYDRNSMDWAEPASLAAFITNREPSINKFARDAVLTVVEKEGVNTQLVNAMAIFQGLNSLGIKYVKDPTGNPGERTLDRVQYPYETMASKTGDCDDTSALVAALLTAVGIKTAMVSYPDHVLVMFDTGIFEKNRFALGADASRMIGHNGTLWIPVETTLINKGFLEAWATAAPEFNQAVREGQRVEIIELEDAWKTFAAVSAENPLQDWKTPGLQTAVSDEFKKMKADTAGSWTKEIGGLEKKDSKTISDKNALGILYARSGNYPKAVETFKKLSDEKLANENLKPQVLSNLACATLLTGDEKAALEILNKANGKEKLAGVAVNRALSFYLKAQNDNDMESFVGALKEANALLPPGTNLGKYLGMDIEEQGGETRAAERQKAEPQKLDQRRLKELIKQRVLSRDVKVVESGKPASANSLTHFGGVRGADPDQVAQIVDLLYWFDI